MYEVCSAEYFHIYEYIVIKLFLRLQIQTMALVVTLMTPRLDIFHIDHA